MSNTKKVTISLTPEQQDKARSLSKDLFGKEKKKRKRYKKYKGSKIESFVDLKVGDYVVHEKHGLGIYRGIEKVEVDKVLKDYIKIDFAQQYAENFNKELTKEDLMYYAKIHTERKGKNENDMHAHIIVSRKTADNKVKISPQTNHKGTTKGTVKGGFDRKEFIAKMEQSFDQKFNYQRNIEESFEYKNAIKNGTFAQRKEQIFKAAAQEKKSNLVQDKKVVLEQKIIEENIKKNRGLRR